MSKTCLIVQPGMTGDLIVVAPIAEYYYKLGYKIFWPIRQKYLRILSRFNYITPIILDDTNIVSEELHSDTIKCYSMFKNYDLILNLADRGPHSLAQLPQEKFEQTKYRLAAVNFENKHKLTWTSDYDKAATLKSQLVKSDKYAVVCNTSSNNERVVYPDPGMDVIMCDKIEGYTIFDWYTIIIGADKIYTTESLVWAFMDANVHELTPERYLLPRVGLKNGEPSTVSKYWKKDLM